MARPYRPPHIDITAGLAQRLQEPPQPVALPPAGDRIVDHQDRLFGRPGGGARILSAMRHVRFSESIAKEYKVGSKDFSGVNRITGLLNLKEHRVTIPNLLIFAMKSP